MMHLIWVLIVGAVIGAIAGAIVGRGSAMGCIANVIAGLVGSVVGSKLFGDWGPHMAGMAIFPTLIGAVLVVIVVSFIVNRFD